ANVPYAGIVTACSQNSKDLLMMSEGPAGRRQATFYVGNGARYDGVSAVPPGVFAPKGWHHLAGTWKSLKIGGDGLLRMYFDGILNSTSKQPLDGVISQTTSLKIGWDDVYLNVPESRRFKGLVDEVMIYDSALSETEVKQIYDAQK
ncbi:MAG: LamG domain-containing protein, partial [bacterium]